MTNNEILRQFAEHAEFISSQVQETISKASDVLPDADARARLVAAVKAQAGDAHMKHIRHVQKMIESSGTKKKLDSGGESCRG